MKQRIIALALVLAVFACAAVASFAEPSRTWPNEHRLFAPCPVTTWARPQAKGGTQA